MHLTLSWPLFLCELFLGWVSLYTCNFEQPCMERKQELQTAIDLQTMDNPSENQATTRLLFVEHLLSHRLTQLYLCQFLSHLSTACDLKATIFRHSKSSLWQAQTAEKITNHCVSFEERDCSPNRNLVKQLCTQIEKFKWNEMKWDVIKTFMRLCKLVVCRRSR